MYHLLIDFDTFSYKDALNNIDDLVREYHVGTFTELLNMTPAELKDINKIIINKQNEEKLQNAMSNK